MDIVQDQTNENVVIGGLIKADPEVRVRVLDRLTLDLFSTQANRDVVAALREMAEAGAEYAADTVVQVSGGRVELQYVLELERDFDHVPPENFGLHVDLLRRATAKRNAVEEWDRLVEAYTDQAAPLSEVEEAASALITRFRGMSGGDVVVSGPDAARAYVDELEEIRSGPDSFRSTGFKELDEYLVEGFRPGLVTTIAGRPSIGKSTVVTNMLVRQLAEGRRWLVVPVEPGIRTVLQQMACIRCKVDYDAFYKRTEKLTDEVMSEVSRLYDEVLGRFRFIEQRVTVDRLISEVRAERPDGVVVDLFEYTLPDLDPNTITQALRSLSACAKEVGTHVVVVQQIRRLDKKPTTKQMNNPWMLRPSIEILKQSGGYNEVSDNVFLLHRDKYYNPSWEADELEIHVAKQRVGPRDRRFVYEFEGPRFHIGRFSRAVEGEYADVDKEPDQEG